MRNTNGNGKIQSTSERVLSPEYRRENLTSVTKICDETIIYLILQSKIPNPVTRNKSNYFSIRIDKGMMECCNVKSERSDSTNRQHIAGIITRILNRIHGDKNSIKVA
uniref:REC8_0 protein n=1 Tax=Fopius arisanus TaxID=64838 RepID=A0A0C9R7Y7_9HYME